MSNRSKTQYSSAAFNPASKATLGAIAILFASLMILGGCATSDPSAVAAARVEVGTARAAGLTRSDSLDFREAERHLAEAEKMLEDNEDQELIDHEAEMAKVYSMVAVSRAEASAAQQEAGAILTDARVNTVVTRVAVEVAIQNARSVDSEQTERGLVLTLGGVLFAYNSADLTPEARLSVARVAGFLIALEKRVALVEGYTDNTGRSEYNVELSKRRADSIRAALIESGVEPERLATEGYGWDFPVASNDSAEGRQKNRRVEIVILKPGLTPAEARR